MLFRSLRFMEHLAQKGIDYQVVRPKQLGFSAEELEKFKQKVLDAEASRERKRAERDPSKNNGRRELGYLLNYAMGRMELVDSFNGENRLIITGAIPQTHSVSVNVPFGSQMGSQKELYESFVRYYFAKH